MPSMEGLGWGIVRLDHLGLLQGCHRPLQPARPDEFCCLTQHMLWSRPGERFHGPANADAALGEPFGGILRAWVMPFARPPRSPARHCANRRRIAVACDPLTRLSKTSFGKRSRRAMPMPSRAPRRSRASSSTAAGTKPMTAAGAATGQKRCPRAHPESTMTSPRLRVRRTSPPCIAEHLRLFPRLRRL
jgi:hypothetical protein